MSDQRTERLSVDRGVGGAYARRMGKKSWATLAFVVGFAVNPALLTGCGLLRPSFSYGEAELLAVIDNANRGGPYRYQKDGVTYEVSFTVSQAATAPRKRAELLPSTAWITEAHACSERTFVRGAGACLDTSTVPVEGTMQVKRLGPGGARVVGSVPVSGKLHAIGTTLGRADLSLKATSGTAAVGLNYFHSSRTFTVAHLTPPAG